MKQELKELTQLRLNSTNSSAEVSDNYYDSDSVTSVKDRMSRSVTPNPNPQTYSTSKQMNTFAALSLLDKQRTQNGYSDMISGSASVPESNHTLYKNQPYHSGGLNPQPTHMLPTSSNGYLTSNDYYSKSNNNIAPASNYDNNSRYAAQQSNSYSDNYFDNQSNSYTVNKSHQNQVLPTNYPSQTWNSSGYDMSNTNSHNNNGYSDIQPPGLHNSSNNNTLSLQDPSIFHYSEDDRDSDHLNKLLAELRVNDVPSLSHLLDPSQILLLTQSPRTRIAAAAAQGSLDFSGHSGVESPPRSPKTMKIRSKLPLQCPPLVSYYFYRYICFQRAYYY